MQVKTMSRGHFQHISYFGRRPLRRCRSEVVRENVEIIDVDNGKPDVVIIDDSETPHEESRCCREKGSTSYIHGVIYIDDEDGDDDDIPINICRTSTSNISQPVSGSHTISEKLQCNKLPISVGKGNSPVKVNSRNQAEGGPSTNWYDLDLSSDNFTSETESNTSECSTSESDSSDCEIIEDSSGSLREQWERASAFKRNMMQGVQLGSEDQTSASGSPADSEFTSHESNENTFMESHLDSSCKIFSKHLEEVHVECGPSSSINDRNVFPKATAEFLEEPLLGTNGEKSAGNSDPSISISSNCYFNFNNFDFPYTSMDDGTCFGADVYHHMEEAGQIPLGDLFSTPGVKCQTSNQHPEKSSPAKRSDTWDGNIFLRKNVHYSNQKEDGLGEQSLYYTPSSHDFIVDHAAQTQEMPFTEHIYAQSDQSPDELRTKPRTCCFSSNEEATFAESTCVASEGDDANKSSYSSDTRSHDIPQTQSDSMGGHIINYEKATEDETAPNIRSIYAGEREKHKESDNYKRAEEEEWAARKQQLQIQSEEAQRLRKKRKAEHLRLLDMEKRQNRRLNEIRESQRKEEEIINMKEVLRDEVRKELDKMEGKFRDMASLLRALGIQVGGGPLPLSREVNAAYKQALLRFHPDRASRTDIRQQVEAEEKFKMISRLKEKLMPLA